MASETQAISNAGSSLMQGIKSVSSFLTKPSTLIGALIFTGVAVSSGGVGAAFAAAANHGALGLETAATALSQGASSVAQMAGSSVAAAAPVL